MDKAGVAKLVFLAALGIMAVSIFKLFGGGHGAWLIAIIASLIVTMGAWNAYSLYRLPEQEQSRMLAALASALGVRGDDHRARDRHEFLSETGSYISYRDDD